MAFEGIQDLWYTLRGELDHESKNLIKEATGHKVDNLVELSEIGMSIYAGKVASKKITGKLGEESEKLSGLLKKTRKPVSIATRTKRLVKKFMPKKRYRKFKVVDIEELSKRQCLKPNIQLFAEESMTRVGRWMSREEYDKMVKTGYVQKPYNAAQSYVAHPADINAFKKQASPGSVYVEFDIPSQAIKRTKDTWATVPGPDSIYSKLNELKGLPPYEFPRATNIKLIGEKK